MVSVPVFDVDADRRSSYNAKQLSPTHSDLTAGGATPRERIDTLNRITSITLKSDVAESDISGVRSRTSTEADLDRRTAVLSACAPAEPQRPLVPMPPPDSK